MTNEFWLKKNIELNQDDIQNILNTLPTKTITDELFSRDAKMVVNHLDETRKIELFREITNEKNINPEIEEEINDLAKQLNPYSLRKHIEQDGLYDTVDTIINCFSVKELLATIATICRVKIMIPKLHALKANQTIVEFENVSLYFSYETCVALRNHTTAQNLVTAQSYSRTTSKHINEMGAGNFTKVSPQEFAQALQDIFKDTA